MRAILMVTAALAVLTVSGCDINSGPPKAAKVDCNCTPTALIAPTAPVAPTPPPDMRGSTAYAPSAARHHWRRHANRAARWGGHSYYWRREYSEVSVPTYDYHSDSHTYYQGYEGGAHSEHDNGYRRVESGWVDGFGRSHATGAGTHGESPDETRARRHPWHGYDAECRDKHRH